ncbi:MAG: hypothetical protein KUG77_13900, partial [Nannocystaceae bacterium]|nr:hypothetical protein [Nannocystaceae bacterium]
MVLMEASRWAATAAVAVFLSGCFSPDDPPMGADTDDASSSGSDGSGQPSGSGPGTSGSSTTDPGTTNPTATDPSDTDPTNPTDPSDTDPTDPTTTGPTTTDPTETTGLDPACGDGSATADELCLDVTPNSLTSPPGPIDVALGDLSSNGLLDIALIAAGAMPNEENRFVVLEADGVGGFIEEHNLAIASSAGRVRLADLDQDDDIDAVVNGRNLTRLRNQGSFFNSAVVVSSLFGNSFDLSDVFIADLNGD